jgi:hypothetical protein
VNGGCRRCCLHCTDASPACPVGPRVRRFSRSPPCRIRLTAVFHWHVWLTVRTVWPSPRPVASTVLSNSACRLLPSGEAAGECKSAAPRQPTPGEPVIGSANSDQAVQLSDLSGMVERPSVEHPVRRGVVEGPRRPQSECVKTILKVLSRTTRARLCLGRARTA